MKKQVENMLLIVVLIAALAGLVLGLAGFIGKGGSESNTASVNTAAASPLTGNAGGTSGSGAQSYGTKTSESSVTVDLTPKSFSDGKFYVDIGVNTHTVDLGGYDLKKAVTLESGSKVFSPVSVPQLSGHHNSGTLVFETRAEPKSFKIVVKGLPDIQERVFQWN